MRPLRYSASGHSISTNIVVLCQLNVEHTQYRHTLDTIMLGDVHGCADDLTVPAPAPYCQDVPLRRLRMGAETQGAATA